MIKKFKDFKSKSINEKMHDVDPVDSNIEEMEEEGVDKFYKNIKDLADKLGVEVNNNKINYKGKEIIYPSETEMFHVDRKKFKTIGEVYDYLTKDNEEASLKELEMELVERVSSKSYIKNLSDEELISLWQSDDSEVKKVILRDELEKRGLVLSTEPEYKEKDSE